MFDHSAHASRSMDPQPVHEMHRSPFEYLPFPPYREMSPGPLRHPYYPRRGGPLVPSRPPFHPWMERPQSPLYQRFHPRNDRHQGSITSYEMYYEPSERPEWESWTPEVRPYHSSERSDWGSRMSEKSYSSSPSLERERNLSSSSSSSSCSSSTSSKSASVRSKAISSLWKVHRQECAAYRRFPAAHPDYEKEFGMYKAKKMQFIRDLGGSENTYDITKDWKTFWISRLEEILEESWEFRLEKCLLLLSDREASRKSLQVSKRNGKSKKYKKRKKGNRSRCRSSSVEREKKERRKSKKKKRCREYSVEKECVRSSVSQRQHSKGGASSEEVKIIEISSSSDSEKDESSRVAVKKKKLSEKYNKCGTKDQEVIDVSYVNDELKSNVVNEDSVRVKQKHIVYSNYNHERHKDASIGTQNSLPNIDKDDRISEVTSTTSSFEEENILEIFEMLSPYGDTLGILEKPLQVIHCRASQLLSKGLNSSKLLEEKYSKMLLQLVNEKFTKMLSEEESLSVIQKVILQEANERLTKILSTSGSASDLPQVTQSASDLPQDTQECLVENEADSGRDVQCQFLECSLNKPSHEILKEDYNYVKAKKTKMINPLSRQSNSPSTSCSSPKLFEGDKSYTGGRDSSQFRLQLKDSQDTSSGSFLLGSENETDSSKSIFLPRPVILSRLSERGCKSNNKSVSVFSIKDSKKTCGSQWKIPSILGCGKFSKVSNNLTEKNTAEVSNRPISENLLKYIRGYDEVLPSIRKVPDLIICSTQDSKESSENEGKSPWISSFSKVCDNLSQRNTAEVSNVSENILKDIQEYDAVLPSTSKLFDFTEFKSKHLSLFSEPSQKEVFGHAQETVQRPISFVIPKAHKHGNMHTKPHSMDDSGW